VYRVFGTDYPALLEPRRRGELAGFVPERALVSGAVHRRASTHASRTSLPRLFQPARVSGTLKILMNQNLQSRKDSLWVLYVIVGAALIGGVFVVGFAVQSSTEAPVSGYVGLLASLASLLVGALLGFLFGIPRALQHDVAPAPPPSGTTPLAQGASATAATPVSYGANTNLEQISDWLTKILVGVGLTQLLTIPDRMRDLATYLRPAFGASEIGERFGLALLLAFLVCGFMAGYLWTRLFLGAALRWADLNALGNVENKVDQLTVAHNANVDAVAQASRQLDPSVPPVDAKMLKDAVSAADTGARTAIYALTRTARREKDCRVVERTIPIWEALLAAETVAVERYRDQAQLAYAVLERCVPDYVRGLTELDEAIAMRKQLGASGRQLLELNRALARIKLDKSQKDQILADLRAAATDPDLLATFPNREPYKSWLEENNLTRDDLRSQPAGAVATP
jgi:hypothetical protein